MDIKVNNMAEVGRPSELNEELMLKIRDLVLEGMSIKDMSQVLEIPYATMRYWSATNYQSFSDKLLSYKHERIIQKAEANLEQLLEGEDDRIRADLSKFALETLSKKNYSKRTDLTTNDKEITLPTTINIVNPNGNE